MAAIAAAPFALSSATASACSLAIPPAAVGGKRIGFTERLFRHWWSREELEFLTQWVLPQSFHDFDEQERRGLLASRDKSSAQAMFDGHFTDHERYKELVAITVVDDEAFVAVTEHSRTGIGPDCSGMPTRHLFLLSFGNGYRNPEGQVASMTLLKSKTDAAFGQVTNWTR